MDQKAFVEAEAGSWWFIDPRTDSAWFEARKALVEPRGWQEPYWLSEPAKLEELYKELEQKAPQLLRELDDMYDTDDAKLAWIESVKKAVAPPEAEATGPPSSSGAIASESGGRVAAPAPEVKKKAVGLFAKKVEQKEEEEAASPVAPEVPAHVTESVTRVLESLSGEASSELALELGLSEEQLAELANDPEFERMVHDEAARLHARADV